MGLHAAVAPPRLTAPPGDALGPVPVVAPPPVNPVVRERERRRERDAPRREPGAPRPDTPSQPVNDPQTRTIDEYADARARSPRQRRH